MNRDRAIRNAMQKIALRGYGPTMRQFLEGAVELAIDAIADELEAEAPPKQALAPSARPAQAEAQVSRRTPYQGVTTEVLTDPKGRKGYDY